MADENAPTDPRGTEEYRTAKDKMGQLAQDFKNSGSVPFSRTLDKATAGNCASNTNRPRTSTCVAVEDTFCKGLYQTLDIVPGILPTAAHRNLLCKTVTLSPDRSK